MKETRTRAVVAQWGIPFGLLFFAVCIILIRFASTSSEKAESTVEKNMLDTVSHYASAFSKNLGAYMVASKPLATLMENYSYQDIELAENISEAVMKNSTAYMVVFCNEKGEGILQDGTRVFLEDTDYYADCSDTEASYTWSRDDGITGESCIVAAVPLFKSNTLKGHLLVYYSLTDFEEIIHLREFDSSAYYAVIDEHDNVICSVGAVNPLFAEEGFWKHILETGTNTKELEKEKNRFDSQLQGMTVIESGDESRDMALVYAPVGINDWKFVLGISHTYVQTLQDREWQTIRALLKKLVVYLIFFVAVVLAINITIKFKELERHKELEGKAETDLLTGLTNKVSTERKISDYMREHPHEQGVLFLLDVDNFKKINDTKGHAFGDEVLQTLGHKLRAEFRVSDIVGRTGGDEFMIFLKDMKGPEGIRKEASRVEDLFHDFRAGEYVKYSVTASIGAAVFPDDAADFPALYKAADAALYRVKQNGKNKLFFFGDEPENVEEAGQIKQ